MDWGSPIFIIAIIAVCGAITLGRNWIQAKHGYDLTDEDVRGLAEFLRWADQTDTQGWPPNDAG